MARKSNQQEADRGSNNNSKEVPLMERKYSKDDDNNDGSKQTKPNGGGGGLLLHAPDRQGSSSTSTAPPSTDGLPLLDSAARRQQQIRLYDEESMLTVLNVSLAHGYIVLLGGSALAANRGNKNKKNKKRQAAGEQQHHELDEGALTLAFLAITEGNVVDACFGVISRASSSSQSPTTSNRASEINLRQIRETKNALADAAFTCDSVQGLAVETYREAFQVVMAYQEKESKFNCLTRCCFARKLRRKTSQRLERVFERLGEAVEASTS